MDFLEKLNYLMKEYHLNKSTLSKACDIPYTTIDGWYKKGYEGLKLTTLRKLAKFFNTTLDYWANNENVELCNVQNGVNPYLPFEINHHETKVITAYHNQPEMQPAVDRLLGVEKTIDNAISDKAPIHEASNTPKRMYVAARNGKSGYVELPPEQEESRQNLLKEKYPELLNPNNEEPPDFF